MSQIRYLLVGSIISGRGKSIKANWAWPSE